MARESVTTPQSQPQHFSSQVGVNRIQQNMSNTPSMYKQRDSLQNRREIHP